MCYEGLLRGPGIRSIPGHGAGDDLTLLPISSAAGFFFVSMSERCRGLRCDLPWNDSLLPECATGECAAFFETGRAVGLLRQLRSHADHLIRTSAAKATIKPTINNDEREAAIIFAPGSSFHELRRRD